LGSVGSLGKASHEFGVRGGGEAPIDDREDHRQVATNQSGRVEPKVGRSPLASGGRDLP
jgi:hypothetical protein